MSNKTVIYFESLIKESNKLNQKEKEILIKRVEGKTLQEIGKKYKITAERVRQKEEKAIIKFMKKFYQLLLFEKKN